MSLFSASTVEPSILVVDDARFNTEMLRRALREAGFLDVRTATSASAALELITERPADILLVDWLMPDMDGLGLTREVRARDKPSGHYTYVILLTAEAAAPQTLANAFAQGVDDFITKSPDQRELTARLHSAARIAATHGALADANDQLLARNRELNDRDGFDLAAGLGSWPYLVTRLEAMIRHLEARGGTGLCGAVRLREPERLEADHGPAALAEALAGVAGRLTRNVRPLDILGRLDQCTFGILMLHHDGEPPHRNSFHRLHRAVNLRAYKTGHGYLNLTTAIAFTAFRPPWSTRPAAEALIEATLAELTDAAESGQIVLRDHSGD